MGAKTLKGLQESGAVYLNAIGGAAQFYAEKFPKVLDVQSFGRIRHSRSDVGIGDRGLRGSRHDGQSRQQSAQKDRGRKCCTPSGSHSITHHASHYFVFSWVAVMRFRRSVEAALRTSASTGNRAVCHRWVSELQSAAFIESVAECVRQGATEILIAPYFLISGYFIRVDLPRCLAEAREKFPALKFRVGEALGYDTRLAEALLDSAAHARTSETWRNELNFAANFCRNSPECPLYTTDSCPHTSQLEAVR